MKSEEASAVPAGGSMLNLSSAHLDAMTGLTNKVCVQQTWLPMALDQVRAEKWVIVYFLDGDHFKGFNDSYGHDEGDQLICYIASIVEHTIAAACVTNHTPEALNARITCPFHNVSRLGGDEFAACLIATDASHPAVMQVAVELNRALEADPYKLPSGDLYRANLSIGVAASNGTEAAGELLRKADRAMYEAKHSGRSATVIHTPDLDEQARLREQVRILYHRAWQDESYSWSVQPIMGQRWDYDRNDYQTRLAGAEVLIRPAGEWERLRSAASLSEELRRMDDLGYLSAVAPRLVRQVLEWMHERRTSGYQLPAFMSVNVSPSLLQDPYHVASLLEVLHQYPDEACRLVLEITRNMPLEERPQVKENMTALQTAGVMLAWDGVHDGDGMRTILRHYPQISIVKLDRMLIQGAVGGTEAEASLAALKNLIIEARRFGKRIIVQGLEGEDEYTLFRHLQGMQSSVEAYEPLLNGIQNAIEAGQSDRVRHFLAEFITPGEVEAVMETMIDAKRHKGRLLGQGYYFAKPMTTDEFALVLAAQATLEAL